MSDKVLYSQCLLQKESNSGFIKTVAYIPSQFAKVDSYIKLKDEDGLWTDGWKVLSAGEPTDHAPDYRKSIRNHRKLTGDSMPKNLDKS